MSNLTIDWDNLPICGSQGVVISPHICLWEEEFPVDPPHGTVPIPGSLALVLIGLIAFKLTRRK